MSKERDDFSQSVKTKLKDRVSGRCSNLDCRIVTQGPAGKDKVNNIGVAAHIQAAAKNGPRYNVNMSKEERRSLHNGIWLCSNCSNKIDRDIDTYSVEILHDWKRKAEEKALHEFGKSLPSSYDVIDASIGVSRNFLNKSINKANGQIFEHLDSRTNAIIEHITQYLPNNKNLITSPQKKPVNEKILVIDKSREYIHEKPYSKVQTEYFVQFSDSFKRCWNEEMAIKPSRDYTLVELFAGAGGLALGLEQAGFKPILLNETDKYAYHTLRTNRSDWNVIEDDIKNVDFTHLKAKVDLLTGELRIPPFSLSCNLSKFEILQGTTLFEMKRAIKEIQPKVFLAESPIGLTKIDSGKVLNTINKMLENLGYTIIESETYEALFYKVPQKRKRFITIAVRSDLYDKLTFKKPPYYYRELTVKDALKAGELYDSDVPESSGQKYSRRKAEIMSFVPEGGHWRDLPIDLQEEYMERSFYLTGSKTGIARRLSWDEPSLNLTCSPTHRMLERCHPSEDRPLTTREYARIQTFPDDWIFKGPDRQVYKQISNAFPINLALAIGKSIVRMLNNE
ncbi:DNA (cytosine-5-)-methyltransferase [Psychrobacter nivimaris]|uniref:DNA (cytosine-5-)-methyltransferase n=1 Tax=Psychrobacter nivimaris TaxID=281738 RepID=UPI001D11FAE7|nr:DNA (cytosine-5-)-methyltransferase [Psychrobacter nivimaris]